MNPGRARGLPLSRRAARFTWRAAAMAMLIFIGAAPGNAQEKLPLTLSHPPIMPYTNAIVAAQAGFFSDAGLDVKRKVLASSDILRAALASGEVEVVALSIDTLARAHATGFDWKILYQSDIYDASRPDAIMIGRSDLTFASAKDFEGKTVAASAGTISETAFRGWMADNGGDSSKVKIIDVPFAQIISGLESKSIDAAHIVEPFMTTAIDKGIGKLAVQHLDDVSPRFLISSYIAKQSWIDANPEKAKRFVQAMTAATQRVNEDPSSLLPILSKETRIAPELLARIFPNHYVISTHIRPVEIQSVIDFLVRQKQIDHGFNYRDIVSAYTPIGD